MVLVTSFPLSPTNEVTKMDEKTERFIKSINTMVTEQDAKLKELKATLNELESCLYPSRKAENGEEELPPKFSQPLDVTTPEQPQVKPVETTQPVEVKRVYNEPNVEFTQPVTDIQSDKLVKKLFHIGLIVLGSLLLVGGIMGLMLI